MGSLTSRLPHPLSFPAAKIAAGYFDAQRRAAVRNPLRRQWKLSRGYTPHATQTDPSTCGQSALVGVNTRTRWRSPTRSLIRFASDVFLRDIDRGSRGDVRGPLRVVQERCTPRCSAVLLPRWRTIPRLNGLRDRRRGTQGRRNARGVRLAALRAFLDSSLAEDAETRHAEQRHQGSTVVRCGFVERAAMHRSIGLIASFSLS